MPPPVDEYELDRGDQLDQLDQSKVDEAVQGADIQNAAPHVESRQARPSYSSKPNPDYIPFLERLRRIPPCREIPWRAGQELPPEKAENSPRVQQRGAIMLSTRGKVMELKCENCARGFGRFSLCVTMEPWFQGACSSCIFTSKGNKCSLRFQTSGTADGRALRYHTENPDALQSYIRSVGDNPPKPTKKRKRRSVPARASPVLNSREHLSESPFPESPDLDTILQAQIAREQASGQQEYTMQVEEKQKQQRFTAQHITAETSGQSRSSAWTPANRSGEPQEALPNSSKSRDAAPVPANRCTAIKENKSLTPGSNTLPERSNIAYGPSGTPLIDTLPKAKQRQIWGLISSLQGGIDHLNAQVVSLKALLGIDVVEEPKPR